MSNAPIRVFGGVPGGPAAARAIRDQDPSEPFVDFVERGIASGRRLLGPAEVYLSPLREADIDALILGRTHYPLLTGVIGLATGEWVMFVSTTGEITKDACPVPARRGVMRDPARTDAGLPEVASR